MKQRLESAMVITVYPGAPAQNAHVDTQDEGSVSVHIPLQSLDDRRWDKQCRGQMVLLFDCRNESVVNPSNYVCCNGPSDLLCRIATHPCSRFCTVGFLHGLPQGSECRLAVSVIS